MIDHEILGITNGIHGPTWIGEPIAEPLEVLGADLDDLDASTKGGRFWERVDRIPGRTCGTPTSARSASSPTSRAAGCAASSPATASRRRSWPSSRPRSTRTS